MSKTFSTDSGVIGGAGQRRSALVELSRLVGVDLLDFAESEHVIVES